VTYVVSRHTPLHCSMDVACCVDDALLMSVMQTAMVERTRPTGEHIVAVVHAVVSARALPQLRLTSDLELQSHVSYVHDPYTRNRSGYSSSFGSTLGVDIQTKERKRHAYTSRVNAVSNKKLARAYRPNVISTSRR